MLRETNVKMVPFIFLLKLFGIARVASSSIDNKCTVFFVLCVLPYFFSVNFNSADVFGKAFYAVL